MTHTQIFCLGIARFISEFQQKPFQFLYERDLQAVLFTRLYDLFQNHPIQLVGGYHLKEEYGRSHRVKTVPVHCEQGSHFDIALLDKKSLIPFSRTVSAEEKWKNDKFWRQPLCAAAELKYYQLGDVASDRVKGLRNDFAKLETYGNMNSRFLGLALLFIQSHRRDVFKSAFPRLALQAMLISPDKFTQMTRKGGIYRIAITPSEIYVIQ